MPFDQPMVERHGAPRAVPPPELRPDPHDTQVALLRPIVQRLHAADAHVVLELGCGSGWFTWAMERCGFDATGIDQDEAGIAAVRRIYPELSILQHRAGTPLPAELVGRFDAAIVIDGAGPRGAFERWTEAAAAALKPGATLLMADAAARWPAWPWSRHGAGTAQPPFPAVRQRLFDTLQKIGLRDVRVESVGRFPSRARTLLGCGRSVA